MLTEIILCSIITVPLLFVLFENNIKKQLRLLDTHADYVKMKSMKDITKTFFGENNLLLAQGNKLLLACFPERRETSCFFEQQLTRHALEGRRTRLFT